MMGKTQKGHCERSFGTNVLELAINATTFSRCPNLLKRTSTKDLESCHLDGDLLRGSNQNGSEEPFVFCLPQKALFRVLNR